MYHGDIRKLVKSMNHELKNEILKSGSQCASAITRMV
jgi:hypothetical protein